MSNKAEELVRQLLEKTESGKLLWRFVPSTAPEDYWIDSENYRTDLEDGSSFLIGRRANGDNKLLTFELTQPGRVVLSEQADNFPIAAETLWILEQGREILDRFDPSKASEPVSPAKIARFRLFSDLFRAARKNAVVEDRTIEKVQQLLERLG
jgi:hypothetical protein